MILVIDDERTFNTNYEQIVYARSSREGMSELALAWTNFSLYYGEKVQRFFVPSWGEFLELYFDRRRDPMGARVITTILEERDYNE